MKREELINVSKKLIGEIIDNYEADAINLPAEMYNELKFHWKQLNKLASHPEVQKQTAEEGLIDLQQYVTNLLYYAHVEAMDMHSIDFDKWVEREVDNIKSYYASQSHQGQLPTLLTDEEIDNHFPIKSEHTALSFEFLAKNKARREGAKWLKSQINKEVKA